MEITQDMIKISTLCGFENVQDYYYLKGYDVYNTSTGYKKKVTYEPNSHLRYPYVTLERKYGKHGKKCLMHRLIALAYIENKPCAVIEHLNDIRTDYSIKNLMLSNQSQNIHRAFVNGHPNRVDKIFILEMMDGTTYKGTIKEISKETGIPKQTIYCCFYRKSPGKKIKSVIEVRSTD